ncbi:hypothetical protein H0266_18250 [Halobacillus locisalis]|uniref:Replication-relaxation n=1 Tax=Halobacillus locisalis TaxID=220753 RepID=A0A838CY23_9BACI|nr:hypothetical protein [Halobacillus locisalis]MBA2176824.1 hypothetical protein [Halobacillus locisalis]
MTTESQLVTPFSIHHHKWLLSWRRIPANPKHDKPYALTSKKEYKVLEAIASVGVIGHYQLKTLFKMDESKIQKMLRKRLIAHHEIFKNDEAIDIYTLDKRGANDVMPEYKSNYWLSMDVKRVLQALSFFQFSYLLMEEPLVLVPSPAPFMGGVKINGKYFYVYIAKGSIEDLTMFLKWKPYFQHRIFIVAEQINQLKSLEVFLEASELKVRVLLEKDLPYLKSGQTLHDLEFYHYDKKQAQEMKWQYS